MSELRILVVRPDAIGDVVLIIPLLNTLKRSLPEAKIYTLQQEYTEMLMKNHPAVEDVILDWKHKGKADGLKGFLSYAGYLKSFKFDMVILPYLDGYYALLTALAAIPVRIGDSNKVFLSPLLTHAVKQNFRNIIRHEVEQNIDLFVRYKERHNQPFVIDHTMDLFVDPEDDLKLDRLLADNGWSGEQLIGIHPASGGGNRAWLPEKYALLIRMIHAETNMRVVITGSGKREEALIRDICMAADDNIINLSNKTTLPLLKALAKKTVVYVGTDTGPTHIAAALKTPVVCISPTKFVKPLRWGPWKVLNRVVGHPEKCLLVCYPYKCSRIDCLESISVEEAFNAVKEMVFLVEDGRKGIDIKKNIRYWFVNSMNILFYISEYDSGFNRIVEYIKTLCSGKVTVHIICSGNKVSEQVHKRLLEVDKACNDFVSLNVIPEYRIAKLIRYISSNDINVIHLSPLKYKVFWIYVIRQITALKLYCPPMIYSFNDEISNYDELIDRYIQEFSLYYN
ncbi:MAG: glycosyltransferase family 9 protein [bacterium]|nr:glycosyltransferase family 9 protein [bacterium]